VENARITSNDPVDLLTIAYSRELAGWFTGVDQHVELDYDQAARDVGTPALLPWSACLVQTGVALAAVRRRDSAAAGRAYDALSPLAGSIAFLPLAIDHLLALLARTMGHQEDAIDHFEAALAFCARAGYRPAYGWTAADYASLLLDRGEPNNHARAIALGNEALLIGRELGMRPLVERVLARRDVLTA
jgi:hypothetical protein